MPHTLIITRISVDSLNIHFLLDSDRGYEADLKSQSTSIALQTLLIYCGYEEGDDSNLKDKKDFTFPYRSKEISIHGRSNVITVLNLLFENPKLFSFHTKHTETIDKERIWVSSAILQLIVQGINEKAFSESEWNNMVVIAKKHYDLTYERIKEDPLFKALPNKDEKNNKDNIYEHHFFQLISLLLDNYINHVPAYNPRLFDRLLNPASKNMVLILERLMPYVPNLYLSRISRGHNIKGVPQFFNIIDPNKIRQSRPQPKEEDSNASEHSSTVEFKFSG